MDFDKVIKVGVTLVIVGILFVRMWPNFVESYKETKEVIQQTTNDINMKKVENYMDSKSDKYVKTNGATYCILIDTLETEGVLSKNSFNKEDRVIQAMYYDDEYHFSINNYCLER